MAKNPENNVFCNLKGEEVRHVRRRMIDCVLSTDMANHPQTLSRLNKKLELFDIKNGRNIERLNFSDNYSKTFENQQAVLSMVIHTADISNPCKPANISKLWVDLLFMEFFKQGDLERKSKLPISLLCDRKTTNINKSQLGFIKFVVKPTFESLMCIMPEVKIYYKNILANESRYEFLTKEEENRFS